VQTVASFLIQRRFHLPGAEERLIESHRRPGNFATAIGKRIGGARWPSLSCMGLKGRAIRSTCSDHEKALALG